MNRIKLAILASTALSLSMGFAQTAGAQVRESDVRGPIANPWTGFYVGGNIGYSWGNAETTASVAPFTQVVPFGIFFPGGASSIPLKPDGVIGGAQFGYNWQLAPHWLAGIEADFQVSSQKGSASGGFSGPTTGVGIACSSSPCSYTNTTDITARLSWFGTVRGRIGQEWNGLLVYGTGGLAYGRVSVSGTNTSSVTETLVPTTVIYSTPFSYSMIKAGWTAGAGIEGRLRASNWSWKAEYLHLDLGSIGSGSFGATPVVTISTGKFTDEIVRFGLNYRI